MKIHTDMIGIWPPQVLTAIADQLYGLTPDEWVEISKEHMWEHLEVLPPIYYHGGFAVSEPWTHQGPNGAPTYLCVSTVGKRHFATHATIPQAEQMTRELRVELKAASLRLPDTLREQEAM